MINNKRFINKVHCKKCDYIWLSKTERIPITCPNCKRYYVIEVLEKLEI